MSDLIWALDLGSRCGWAHGTSHADIASGTQVLKRPGDDKWYACHVAMRWLNSTWRMYPPSHVIVEALLPLQAHRDRNNSEAAVDLPRHLLGVVAGLAGFWNITPTLVGRRTVLKHFVDDGGLKRSPGKAAVIHRCRALKYVPPTCTDDNQCDAIAMLDWALASLRRDDIHRKLLLFGEAAE